MNKMIWTFRELRITEKKYLQLLEEARKVPDVLILDIIMPHLDGLGVLGAVAGYEFVSNA